MCTFLKFICISTWIAAWCRTAWKTHCYCCLCRTACLSRCWCCLLQNFWPDSLLLLSGAELLAWLVASAVWAELLACLVDGAVCCRTAGLTLCCCCCLGRTTYLTRCCYCLGRTAYLTRCCCCLGRTACLASCISISKKSSFSSAQCSATRYLLPFNTELLASLQE